MIAVTIGQSAPVSGRVQMKLGAVSRHFVGGGLVWSLRMIVKSIGGFTASVAGVLG
jgi:hypothetical protein